MLLAALAALFAVALSGLSGWLIIRASEQPPILYLLGAIVGVRFFGIGRAVLRYAERLVVHDTVFAAMTRLRGALWATLSARALSLRRLLQGGNVLGAVVDDVDTLRDVLPRVVLPRCQRSPSRCRRWSPRRCWFPPPCRRLQRPPWLGWSWLRFLP
ncbi:ATP-binding/permease protein CydD [Arthrobacter sp. Hiyo8]|nr:ATP-binding/permease protein CydD [Arthrobacter sp. Hiyo8]